MSISLVISAVFLLTTLACLYSLNDNIKHRLVIKLPDQVMLDRIRDLKRLNYA